MGWIKSAVDRTLGYSTEKRSWTFSIKPSNSEINLKKNTQSQMLHVWNIYQHFPSKSPSFVGKYTSTMEHLGVGYPATSFFGRFSWLEETSIRWKDPPLLIWVNQRTKWAIWAIFNSYVPNYQRVLTLVILVTLVVDFSSTTYLFFVLQGICH